MMLVFTEYRLKSMDVVFFFSIAMAIFPYYMDVVM